MDSSEGWRRRTFCGWASIYVETIAHDEDGGSGYGDSQCRVRASDGRVRVQDRRAPISGTRSNAGQCEGVEGTHSRFTTELITALTAHSLAYSTVTRNRRISSSSFAIFTTYKMHGWLPTEHLLSDDLVEQHRRISWAVTRHASPDSISPSPGSSRPHRSSMIRDKRESLPSSETRPGGIPASNKTQTDSESSLTEATLLY